MIESLKDLRTDGKVVVARDLTHIRFQLIRAFDGLKELNNFAIPIPSVHDPNIITRNSPDSPIYIGPPRFDIKRNRRADADDVEFGLWRQLDRTPVAQVLLTGIAGGATTWWEPDFIKALSWVSGEGPIKLRDYRLKLEPDRTLVSRGNELIAAALIGETKELDFGYPVPPGLALVYMTALPPETSCLRTHMG